MFGLSLLGLLHTVASLLALGVAAVALARTGEIVPHSRLGLAYMAATFVTAATAFGLSRHGGFGPAHVLAVLTLLALAGGLVVANSGLGGRRTRQMQALCLSTTLLLHAIPGVTETLTRLPPGAPLLPGPEAPAFKPIYAALLLLFVLGVTLQWRQLSRSAAAASPAPEH